MASMEAPDESNMSDELSFLDLNDCSTETKSFLLSLIENEPPKKPPPVQAETPNQPQPQQPPSTIVQQQHFQQQVYATPPTSQPYVYINQVTANVNVHHGTEQRSHPVVSNHSGGFPPPPPNPMAFPNPPVVSAAAPGLIPNGATGNFLPQTHPSHIIYQHQFAALAAKAGAPQAGQSLYMPTPVICYPYPITVLQQTAPQPPQATPRPPNVMRSSPNSFPSTVPMMTSAQTTEAYYPVPPYHQPQPPAVTSTSEETTIQVEQEQTEPEESVAQSEEVFEELEEEIEEAENEELQENVEEKADESEGAKSSNGGSKSWASLFHKDTPSSSNINIKPTARIQPYTNVSEDSKKGSVDSRKKDDASSGEEGSSNSRRHQNRIVHQPHDIDIAKFLQSYALTHRSCMIKPRGLSNRNNWCFVNAILQALVACPPFYNLIKSLPQETVDKASMIKITRVVRDFMAEFSPLDHFPKFTNRRDKGKKNEDLPLGMTFEASSVFQFLLNLSDETFKVVDGRQEDAEEFLTFLLNKLNDEMLGMLKLLIDDEEEEMEAGEDEDDSDEWRVVGDRNKSLLTRRVGDSNESLKSPVASIFQGQLQSCVQSSNGEPTATLQPFFTLPLDIQSKSIKNVSDALLHNFTAETIDGYLCSKTNKEIEASRSLYLDELPSVLILHLKRFIYDETSSAGCQKLLKNIDFPVDLEIPRDILSSNSKNKYHNKQRSYKLFAVVYHNGKEASLGHYVTDVYHAGLGWLHCDDSLIKSMTENMVLAHSANSVPYILFYRRGDTMGPGPNAAMAQQASAANSSNSSSAKS